MNERIQKLADNATHYANSVCDADANADWYETRDQKFAELLLKDVLTIVKNNTPNPDPYSRYDMQEAAERTANYIRDEIKYHFGVKE